MARRLRIAVAVVGVVAALVVVIGGFFGLRALVRSAGSKTVAYDHCDIGSYQLDPDQAVVAATMVGEVTRYDNEQLPERAAVLALAAGLQESKLRNLPPGAGDRDSVGVLQQRPSQGWGGGNAAKLNNVAEATKEFLDHLIKIPGWESLPLDVAVQDVQISADGSLYAPHEPEAQALADALQGHVAAGINCIFTKPTALASVATVAAQVTKNLPVNPPVTVAGTAEVPGSVEVPGAAWQTAAWFVANADQLGIAQVGYAGKQWTPAHGWRAATTSPTEVVATMYLPKN